MGTGTALTYLHISAYFYQNPLGFHTPQHNLARGAPLLSCPSTAGHINPQPSTTIEFTWHKKQPAAATKSRFHENLLLSRYFDGTARETTRKICSFPLTGAKKTQTNPVPAASTTHLMGKITHPTIYFQILRHTENELRDQLAKTDILN